MSARGCGSARQMGGVYIEMTLGAGGRCVEEFLLDPIERVPKILLDTKSIKQRGINWHQQDGVWHIVDWVGEKHYKNAADFIEEVRVLGLSRLMPPHMEFERLSSASRHIIMHPRAHIYTSSQVVDYTVGSHGVWTCPKRIASHGSGKGKKQVVSSPKSECPKSECPKSECCAGMIWEMVSGGEAYTAPEIESYMDSGSDGVPRLVAGNVVVGGRLYRGTDPRLVRRQMPSFDYMARSLPPGVPARVMAPKQVLHTDPLSGVVSIVDMLDASGNPVLEEVSNIGPGYLASFPIGRIAVVRGESNGVESSDTVARIRSKTSVSVVEVNE